MGIDTLIFGGIWYSVALRRWRDHENCGGDESRNCAIETSQSALTLRLCLGGASISVSPLRVSSLAADTKRLFEPSRKNTKMWGIGNGDKPETRN